MVHYFSRSIENILNVRSATTHPNSPPPNDSLVYNIHFYRNGNNIIILIIHWYRIIRYSNVHKYNNYMVQINEHVKNRVQQNKTIT